MIYKIKDIKKDLVVGYNTIAGLEDIIFASYDSERSMKIFSNKDDTFRIKTTGSYYMKKIDEISIDELPIVLRVLEKMDCKIHSEEAGMADSYAIKSDKKIFKVRDIEYKYMYLLPTFNDHRLAMFVSNADESFYDYKEAIENV